MSNGRTTIVLTWDFAQGAAKVWSLLSNPETLRSWAPYSADRDLSQVGRVVLTMLGDGVAPDVDIPGFVLVADVPRVLEYSWGSDMLAWRLTAIGSGTRLTLHQTLADASMASANAAGWHLCLEVAAAVLDGRQVSPVRGMAAIEHGWAQLNEGYAAALGVTPTRLSEIPKTA